MFTIAFSTVACPDWTLTEIAQNADAWGYEGVELRSFGDGNARIAGEPALTDPSELRALFDREGVAITGLATSVRFDEKVGPPLVGLVFGDNEKSVREAKRFINLARTIDAPLVRVFAFEPAEDESRKSALRRIIQRLKLVGDDLRHSGVRVMLENGGGFPLGEDVKEIIDTVDNPLVGACYSVAVGARAGEDPMSGLEAIGDDLLGVRVRDLRDGHPCLPGDGEIPVGPIVKRLVGRFDGPLIFEWDRMWSSDLAPAEEALPEAARRLFGWVSEAQRRTREPEPAGA